MLYVIMPLSEEMIKVGMSKGLSLHLPYFQAYSNLSIKVALFGLGTLHQEKEQLRVVQKTAEIIRQDIFSPV